ncbi:hypothetical protein M0R72_11320 [Candidatus Pacearchaeota archaeon]|nr:hypothetical protein [Candidatus Pacearchaeota archaeon]
MPNRIIKESICTSCDIEQLAPMEEVFFYRLIVNCDDYGRMDGRAPILRAKCFPLRLGKVSDAMVDGYLTKLVSVGMVQKYAFEGKPYIQITAWEKHQQQRAKRSKYPSPDGNGYQMISDVPVIQSETETETESGSEKENSKEKFEVKPGVFLSATECERLMDQFGETGANERIAAFSESKLAHGYKYKSDYHAILTWARKDKPKGNGHKPARDPSKYIGQKNDHMVVR